MIPFCLISFGGTLIINILSTVERFKLCSLHLYLKWCVNYCMNLKKQIFLFKVDNNIHLYATFVCLFY